MMVIYMYIAPVWGADKPQGSKFVKNLKSSVTLPISCKFCPSNDIFFFNFSHSNAWATYADLAIKEIKVITGSGFT